MNTLVNMTNLRLSSFLVFGKISIRVEKSAVAILNFGFVSLDFYAGVKQAG
jgi:hypothetical protein